MLLYKNFYNRFSLLERQKIEVSALACNFIQLYLSTNIFITFLVFKKSFVFFFFNLSTFFVVSNFKIFFFNIKELKLFFLNISKLMQFLTGNFIELFLEGLYYRVKYYKLKNYLGFLIGFSHYVIVKVPTSIFIRVHTKRRKFIILSLDKQQLGLFANFLTNIKFPNIYIGKGIKILNIFYRKKKILKKR